MTNLHVCLALTLFVSGSCLAADSTAPAASSLQSIVDQQRALAADLDAGRRKTLTIRQQNAISKAQEEVFGLFEGKTSLNQLSIDEKVRLENALERINAEVKVGNRMATDEQTVCWRERKSGSSMKVTRCGTQAERDQVRQGAREWMEKPSVCTPPGCG